MNKIVLTKKQKHCNNNYSQTGAAGSYRYSEGTQMLKLGHYLKDALVQNKYSAVKITRQLDLTRDVFSDGVLNEAHDDLGKCLRTRGIYAKGTDYFISLHTNAVYSWYEPNNWGVIAFPNLTCQGDKNALKLAADLGETAAKTITPNGLSIQNRIRFDRTLKPSTNCGVMNLRYKGAAYYAVTRAADSVGVPGILLEHSFHTNPAVRSWMLSDSNLKKLAKAEAKAILTHYGFPV